MTSAPRLVLAPLVFAFAALGFFGCRQIVGIDDSRNVPACGGFIYADTSCAKCVEGACCSESIACQKDAECQKAYTCAAGCAPQDSGCRVGCRDQLPTDTASPILYRALEDCRATACASQCTGCSGLLDEFPKDCDACVQASCCGLVTDCEADPSCSAAYTCLRDCVLPDCQNECIGGGQAAPSTQNMQQCIVQNCTTSCGLGTEWSCLSHYSWGRSKNSTATIHMKVTDILTGNVTPGATVRACATLINDCGSPSDATITDANGMATLTLPLNKLGTGYIGYISIIQPNETLETLIFPGKPILHDDSFNFLVGTQHDLVGLMEQFKVGLTPDTGLLFVSALDCRGMPAPNVNFALDQNASTPTTQVIYFNGVTPNPNMLTTAFGTAAYLNVAPGNRQITEFLGGPSGERVGAGIAIVKPNAITEIVVPPLATL